MHIDILKLPLSSVFNRNFRLAASALWNSRRKRRGGRTRSLTTTQTTFSIRRIFTRAGVATLPDFGHKVCQNFPALKAIETPAASSDLGISLARKLLNQTYICMSAMNLIYLQPTLLNFPLLIIS